MKKQIISFFLIFSFIIPAIPSALALPDEKILAANELYYLGLLQGVGTKSDGTPDFGAGLIPTRHEAVTMLVRLLGKEEEAKNRTWDIPFTDVADWAKPYVGYAYSNGLTSGTSDTTFSGDLPVNAAQYLTFTLRALGYDSGKDFQWEKPWELSDQLGITCGQYSEKRSYFDRGDAILISNYALSELKKKDDPNFLSATKFLQSFLSNSYVQYLKINGNYYKSSFSDGYNNYFSTDKNGELLYRIDVESNPSGFGFLSAIIELASGNYIVEDEKSNNPFLSGRIGFPVYTEEFIEKNCKISKYEKEYTDIENYNVTWEIKIGGKTFSSSEISKCGRFTQDGIRWVAIPQSVTYPSKPGNQIARYYIYVNDLLKALNISGHFYFFEKEIGTGYDHILIFEK